MSRIIYIGCGDDKTVAPARAKYLYTSGYFSKKRQYAEAFSDWWAVLSAKYAVLDSEAVVPWYDMTMDEYPVAESRSVPYRTIEKWSDAVVEQTQRQVENMNDSGDAVEELILLAGKDYRTPVLDRLNNLGDRYGFEVANFFTDTSGFGYQMSKINAALEQETPTPVWSE